MLHAFGIARIQHADTGEVYEIDKGLLDLDSKTHFARKEGIELEHYATFDHEQLGWLTWTVWEHSSGFIKHHEYDVKNHKLLENFKFRLADEMPDDEERQRNIDEMVKWFHRNYQDLDEGGLYFESKAGGYVGDIRDTSEELQGKFPYEYDDVIEAAVEEIEARGNTEWTPIYDDKELLINDSLEDIEYELNTLTDNAPKPKTAPAFALGNDNRFHIIDPPDNQPIDNQNNLLNGLRTITNDLLQSLSGANAHQDLIPIIEKYNEALLGDEISISQLYWCGIRLDKIAQIIKRGIAEKELPSLPTNTETYLESALEIHGTYIMSNPEGQILVRDSVAYRQPPEKTEVLKTAGEQFANSIKENSNLFGEDVQEHFRDFSNDIGKGQYPERSNQSFGNTVINFVSSILRWIKRPEGMAISAIFGGAVVTSVPGKITIKAGAGLIDTVYYFLINSASSIKAFATQSPWLADVVQILERIISIIR